MLKKILFQKMSSKTGGGGRVFRASRFFGILLLEKSKENQNTVNIIISLVQIVSSVIPKTLDSVIPKTLVVLSLVDLRPGDETVPVGALGTVDTAVAVAIAVVLLTLRTRHGVRDRLVHRPAHPDRLHPLVHRPDPLVHRQR